MIRHIGLHRPNHTQIIGMLGGLLEQIAHLQAALAIALEFKRRLPGRTRFSFGRKVNRDFLAMPLRQRRLGIEGVNVRWTAIHEQMDDPLGLGPKLGSANTHGACRSSQGSGRGSQSPHHGGKAKRTHAHAAPVQKLATRQGKVLRAKGMGVHDSQGYATGRAVLATVYRQTPIRPSGFMASPGGMSDFESVIDPVTRLPLPRGNAIPEN